MVWFGLVRCGVRQGLAANVGKAADARELADYAVREMGRVDIW